MYPFREKHGFIGLEMIIRPLIQFGGTERSGRSKEHGRGSLMLGGKFQPRWGTARKSQKKISNGVVEAPVDYWVAGR